MPRAAATASVTSWSGAAEPSRDADGGGQVRRLGHDDSAAGRERGGDRGRGVGAQDRRGARCPAPRRPTAPGAHAWSAHRGRRARSASPPAPCRARSPAGGRAGTSRGPASPTGPTTPLRASARARARRCGRCPYATRSTCVAPAIAAAMAAARRVAAGGRCAASIPPAIRRPSPAACRRTPGEQRRGHGRGDDRRHVAHRVAPAAVHLDRRDHDVRAGSRGRRGAARDQRRPRARRPPARSAAIVAVVPPSWLTPMTSPPAAGPATARTPGPPTGPRPVRPAPRQRLAQDLGDAHRGMLGRAASGDDDRPSGATRSRGRRAASRAADPSATRRAATRSASAGLRRDHLGHRPWRPGPDAGVGMESHGSGAAGRGASARRRPSPPYRRRWPRGAGPSIRLLPSRLNCALPTSY